MQQISEPDWKVSKKLHPVALERFYARAMLEIAALMEDKNSTPTDRFWKVFKVTEKQGKDVGEIFDDYRRSTALLQLGIMRRRELLTDEEMSLFSPDALAFVQRILSLGKT